MPDVDAAVNAAGDSPEMLAEATARIVKAHVDAAVAELRAEIADVRAQALEWKELVEQRTAEKLATRDTEALERAVTEQVASAVAALPTPEKGEAGAGVAAALIDRDGALVLTLSDGRTANLGRVVGKDADMAALEARVDAAIAARPAPKDGRDAFALEDFSAELLDDGRTVRLKFAAGDESRDVKLAFPVMIYRGVYRPGQPYAVGDTVTCAGSTWHCNAAGTAEKPGFGDDWQMIVKRGVDGSRRARLGE